MPKGVTITVTAEKNKGCRRHMEDHIAIKLTPTRHEELPDYLKQQAYIGVFDGHGGEEAAKYARDKLWDVIQSQPKYKLPDFNSVKESLEDAYIALHEEMRAMRDTWKRTKTGGLSTAGTTACTVIFRQDHIFVANVGDSTAVLAINAPQPNQHPIKAVVLTNNHKPEDPKEAENIEKLGGSVMKSKKGVTRVVRQRENGDSIPYLNITRSLGDFWSFNPTTGQFVVSPKPDVHVHPFDLNSQQFIVIASDGLWDVMSPDEVVQFIWDYKCDQDQKRDQPQGVVGAIIKEALWRWRCKPEDNIADNIAVLIAFLSEVTLADDEEGELTSRLGKHERTDEEDIPPTKQSKVQP